MRQLQTASIYDLINKNDFANVREAIVETFESLLTGVTISSHPGKLDISDIVAADIKKLPAIMVGWTRQQVSPTIANHFSLNVEFTAYIAVNDMVQLSEKRRINREDAAAAIGFRILQILNHDEHNTFGVSGLLPPMEGKPPEFKPVFTSKSYAKGVAYYSVIWSQTIIDQGASIATDDQTQVTGFGDTLELSPGSDPENDVIQAIFKDNEDPA